MNTETYTRQQKRALERELAKPAPSGKVGPGRRNKWLQRHPKLAPFYLSAIRLLQANDRAQRPSWKAVRKMMVLLATGMRVKAFGRSVPFMFTQPQHERGRWRTFPHVTIDANLAVSQ